MSNKTFLRQASGLLAAGALLAGCAHHPTVVGKWQGTVPSQRGGNGTMTFTFGPDGKETMDIEASAGPMKMQGLGTYTVSGDTLTQNITSMTMGGQTMPVPAGQAKPQASPFTLDGDKLTLKDPAGKQSLTLTRVKE